MRDQDAKIFLKRATVEIVIYVNIKHASEPWEYNQFIFSSLNRVRDVIKKKNINTGHTFLI